MICLYTSKKVEYTIIDSERIKKEITNSFVLIFKLGSQVYKLSPSIGNTEYPDSSKRYIHNYSDGTREDLIKLANEIKEVTTNQ